MRTLKFIVDSATLKENPNCNFEGLFPAPNQHIEAEFSFSKEWESAVKVAAFYSILGIDGTPQVITPSKKLSECRTGWMLLWSDYDSDGGVNDSDFCTTLIPKRTPSGGTWGGKAFYCDIPMFVGSTPTDLSTEQRCIKPVYVHDDCLKGSYQNTQGGRNDVVLRAIYEF